MKTSQSLCSLLVLTMLLSAVLVAKASSNEGQELKRRVAPKQVCTALPEGVNADLVVFKLREGTSRPQVVNGAFVHEGIDWDRLNQIISSETKTVALRPRISLDVLTLDRMRAEGSRRVGWQLPDMSLYFEIQFRSDLPVRDRLDIVNRLNALDLIEIAYFSPRFEVPRDDVGNNQDFEAEKGDPQTPNWEDRQYYLRQAPLGLDAFYAWSFPGGRGENVMAIDIEDGWTETHEDLHGGIDSFFIGGEVSGEDVGHGTAVLGILAADSNTFGTTGVSYNVDLGTYGVTVEGDYPYLSDAILTCSAVAEEGDIILIEFHIVADDGNTWVAMEYVQENFDAILTVSALGQIVVEPAGNGNANYDDTNLFDSLFYPEYRFSGAIFVGDCYHNHTPTGRSGYGQRLDVHGFGGYDIYTHGVGYLYGDNPDNYYTAWFSGTSAASPEIVGACAVLQGIHKELYGTTLDHAQLRSLLTTYSTPQADHYKRVGPMPDLAGSCDAITGFIRPARPVLLSPEDGAFYDAPALPVLDWDDVAGATSYDVLIDDNKDFISPLARQDGLMATQWTTPALARGQYHWRVRANNAEGFGAWSAPRVIRVDVDFEAPVLYAPIDDERIIYSKGVPRLEWSAIEGVTDYVIEADWLSDFSSPYRRFAYSLPCEGDTCFTYVNFPQGGFPYYWRVKALGDEWPWSEVQRFDLLGNLKVNEPKGPREKAAITERPERIELLRNHPNPFNPTTEISFTLSHAGHVTLEVFNIKGQRISTLVNRQVEAGYHTVSFDGSKVASGVYLYRLQAGDFVESRKMLLLK